MEMPYTNTEYCRTVSRWEKVPTKGSLQLTYPCWDDFTLVQSESSRGSSIIDKKRERYRKWTVIMFQRTAIQRNQRQARAWGGDADVVDSHTRGDDPDRRIETEPREVAARAEERDATPGKKGRWHLKKMNGKPTAGPKTRKPVSGYPDSRTLPNMEKYRRDACKVPSQGKTDRPGCDQIWNRCMQPVVKQRRRKNHVGGRNQWQPNIPGE